MTVAFVVEYLDRGFGWRPVCESTARTGFVMRPVEHPTREAAEASFVVSAGAEFRVVEVESPAPACAVMPTLGGD